MKLKWNKVSRPDIHSGFLYKRHKEYHIQSIISGSGKREAVHKKSGFIPRLQWGQGVGWKSGFFNSVEWQLFIWKGQDRLARSCRSNGIPSPWSAHSWAAGLSQLFLSFFKSLFSVIPGTFKDVSKWNTCPVWRQIYHRKSLLSHPVLSRLSRFIQDSGLSGFWAQIFISTTPPPRNT